jgi:hypothetical protein
LVEEVERGRAGREEGIGVGGENESYFLFQDAHVWREKTVFGHWGVGGVLGKQAIGNQKRKKRKKAVNAFLFVGGGSRGGWNADWTGWQWFFFCEKERPGLFSKHNFFYFWLF